MTEKEVQSVLLNTLRFNQDAIYKIDTFCREVFDYNKKFNLISKSTEINIWDRHVLDSAQLVKYIEFKDDTKNDALGIISRFVSR